MPSECQMVVYVHICFNVCTYMSIYESCVPMLYVCFHECLCACCVPHVPRGVCMCTPCTSQVSTCVHLSQRVGNLNVHLHGSESKESLDPKIERHHSLQP